MKTPSIEEIKNYFKNAETISCAYSGEECEFEDLINIYHGIYFTNDIYADKGCCTIYEISLFDNEKGYAKILTTK